jgi:hypothetical protein
VTAGNGRSSATGLFLSQMTSISPRLTRLIWRERLVLASWILTDFMFQVDHVPGQVATLDYSAPETIKKLRLLEPAAE